MENINKQDSKLPLAALHRLEFILQHKSDQLLRPDLGIGFGQLRIMEGLDSSTSCSQRKLAAKLYQTEANISRQLRLLQKKRLVEITRDPKDKRQRQVKLTTKGTDSIARANKLLAKLHKEILAKVDFRDAYNFTETAERLAASEK